MTQKFTEKHLTDNAGTSAETAAHRDPWPGISHAMLLGLVIAALSITPARAEPPPTPLPRAHAHNDYHHARPLFDALDQGFCSVEADIFLVGERLLVAHTAAELVFAKTLEELYLEPLRRRIRENDGSVHGDGTPFTLLIDVKTDARPTYARLHQVLADYADILTKVENGTVKPGPVTAVISGNRSVEAMRQQTVCCAGYDGRLGDLDSDLPGHFMPLISDRWTSHFRWRGEGPMPEAERAKLHRIVEQAHAKGRRVRFWATPENEAVWAELRDADVDLINTDHLARLRAFLLRQR